MPHAVEVRKPRPARVPPCSSGQNASHTRSRSQLRMEPAARTS